jgi:hypothetical protein
MLKDLRKSQTKKNTESSLKIDRAEALVNPNSEEKEFLNPEIGLQGPPYGGGDLLTCGRMQRDSTYKAMPNDREVRPKSEVLRPPSKQW